jgi:hypothetical protein
MDSLCIEGSGERGITCTFFVCMRVGVDVLTFAIDNNGGRDPVVAGGASSSSSRWRFFIIIVDTTCATSFSDRMDVGIVVCVFPVADGISTRTEQQRRKK